MMFKVETYIFSRKCFKTFPKAEWGKCFVLNKFYYWFFEKFKIIFYLSPILLILVFKTYSGKLYTVFDTTVTFFEANINPISRSFSGTVFTVLQYYFTDSVFKICQSYNLWTNLTYFFFAVLFFPTRQTGVLPQTAAAYMLVLPYY